MMPLPKGTNLAAQTPTHYDDRIDYKSWESLTEDYIAKVKAASRIRCLDRDLVRTPLQPLPQSDLVELERRL
jgi:dihydrodipicolinate synthase/N-acetylneuraminate lyase